MLKNCVKSVRIRSYSGPHFPAFGLNTEIYSPYSVRMRENAGKMRTRINPNTDTLRCDNEEALKRLNIFRSSRPKLFSKKGVLRKFTGKQLCQSIFLNKFAGLRPATLLKKNSDM